MQNNSYIKLYRSLMENPLWTGEPFTKGQAWVDLLMLARWKDEKKLNGQTLHRGEIGASQLWLANRWGWSRKKTARFLSVLEREQMCTIKSTQKGTTLTIEKYSIYQGEGTTEGTTEETTGAQLREQQARTYKESNNSNKEKNIIKRELKEKRVPEGLPFAGAEYTERELIPEDEAADLFRQAHEIYAPIKEKLIASRGQREGGKQ